TEFSQTVTLKANGFPGRLLCLFVSWWQMDTNNTHHKGSMILRLATANENGRRGACPMVGAALCGRPSLPRRGRESCPAASCWFHLKSCSRPAAGPGGDVLGVPGQMRLIPARAGGRLGFYGRRYACGLHHATKRSHWGGRRLIVPEPVTLRDRQRRPSLLVLPIPDFDFGALAGEELHGGREVLVGRPVHGGLPVVVDGVNVGPEIQCRLHGLQHF